MTAADTLDPLIHVPARLRIVVTLAALRDGDALSFTRLQNMIGLTPGNLITHLRKLEDAGYLSSEKTGNGTASFTSIALTGQGRAALTPTPPRYATSSTGFSPPPRRTRRRR
jgi:DNA-binding transcriptional ArsR family regulator